MPAGSRLPVLPIPVPSLPKAPLAAHPTLAHPGWACAHISTSVMYLCLSRHWVPSLHPCCRSESSMSADTHTVPVTQTSTPPQGHQLHRGTQMHPPGTLLLGTAHQHNVPHQTPSTAHSSQHTITRLLGPLRIATQPGDKHRTPKVKTAEGGGDSEAALRQTCQPDRHKQGDTMTTAPPPGTHTQHPQLTQLSTLQWHPAPRCPNMPRRWGEMECACSPLSLTIQEAPDHIPIPGPHPLSTFPSSETPGPGIQTRQEKTHKRQQNWPIELRAVQEREWG